MLDEDFREELASHELHHPSRFLLTNSDLSRTDQRRFDQHGGQHTAMVLQQAVSVHFGKRPTSHHSRTNHHVARF
jgi:hypothetical protein